MIKSYNNDTVLMIKIFNKYHKSLIFEVKAEKLLTVKLKIIMSLKTNIYNNCWPLKLTSIQINVP